MKTLSLVGRIAGACVVLFWVSHATAIEQMNDAPKFSSTSSEPVLLRYKLKNGQVLKMSMDVDSNVSVHAEGKDIKMLQGMRLDAKVVVTNVDGAGNISVLTKITRMKMTMSGAGAKVEYDSDHPDNADEAFKGVQAMINVGIPCKVTPLGEMLETDLEPIRLAIRRSGNAALIKSMEESTSKMFEGTFIQLSKAAIGAGETYKAGTVIANDKLKMHMSYKVRSVSGDKTKAILDPMIVMDMAPGAFQGAEATFKSQEISGWQMFDVEKGYPGDARINVKAVIEIKADGQTATIDMISNSKISVTLE